ncbi:MAG: ABC transporter ATP-binding protein [Eubacteriales bacterium]|nr:ABC transporter ATP-binding protein [Eubacteriales bacterium]
MKNNDYSQAKRASFRPLFKLIRDAKFPWIPFLLLFALQLIATKLANNLTVWTGEIFNGEINNPVVVRRYILASFGLACIGLTVIPNSWIIWRFTQRLQLRSWHKFIHLPLRRYDELMPSSLVSRVTTDAPFASNFIVYVANVFQDCYNLYLATVILFAQSVRISTYILPLILVSALVSLLFSRYAFSIMYQIQQVQSRLTLFLNEKLPSLTFIKSCRSEVHEIKNGAKLTQDVCDAQQRSINYRILIEGYQHLSTIVVNAIVLIVGAHEIAAGNIPAGSLITIFLIARTYPGTVMTVFRNLLQLFEIKGQTYVVSELCELPEEQLESEASPKPVLANEDIVLDNVHFSYHGDFDLAAAKIDFLATKEEEIEVTDSFDAPPPGEHEIREVLSGVNLRIKHGKHTAIVGPSGSGKTTLLKLIERFYEPDSGEIRLGDCPVENYHRGEWRESIGYVIQNPTLLPGTIEENILYAWTKREDSKAALTRALQLSNFDEVLPLLDNGLQTDVGDLGNRLSGGQRQRIAIARALVDEKQILLLDEATSNMDAKNESEISHQILQARKGKTTIVVAHRLSTAKDCDHIVVMDQGRVVDEGTHDQLYQSCNLYREMVELQQI